MVHFVNRSRVQYDRVARTGARASLLRQADEIPGAEPLPKPDPGPTTFIGHLMAKPKDKMNVRCFSFVQVRHTY